MLLDKIHTKSQHVRELRVKFRWYAAPLLVSFFYQIYTKIALLYISVFHRTSVPIIFSPPRKIYIFNLSVSVIYLYFKSLLIHSHPRKFVSPKDFMQNSHKGCERKRKKKKYRFMPLRHRVNVYFHIEKKEIKIGTKFHLFQPTYCRFSYPNSFSRAFIMCF